MATFSVTTTADQDTAAAYYSNQYNNATPAPPVQLTALQWAKVLINELFQSYVNKLQNDTGASKAQEYLNLQALANTGNTAAITDKNTIDTTLDKYK